MRRGYWTGFIMGGILGMMAAKVYGDGLLGKLFPALSGEDEERAELRPGRIRANGYRPRRRRLAREV